MLLAGWPVGRGEGDPSIARHACNSHARAPRAGVGKPVLLYTTNYAYVPRGDRYVASAIGSDFGSASDARDSGGERGKRCKR